jgi:hypothetical protein
MDSQFCYGGHRSTMPRLLRGFKLFKQLNRMMTPAGNKTPYHHLN